MPCLITLDQLDPSPNLILQNNFLRYTNMPTFLTDPRSGGVKKSSGVNVLPIVSETWALVRDNSNSEVDWLIASFDGSSKTDITVIASGSGGIEACSAALPEGKASYGGVRTVNGRFVTFYYAPDSVPVMQRGRGKARSSVKMCVCLNVYLNLYSNHLCWESLIFCIYNRLSFLCSINVQKW